MKLQRKRENRIDAYIIKKIYRGKLIFMEIRKNVSDIKLHYKDSRFLLDRERINLIFLYYREKKNYEEWFLKNTKYQMVKVLFKK